MIKAADKPESTLAPGIAGAQPALRLASSHRSLSDDVAAMGGRKHRGSGILILNRIEHEVIAIQLPGRDDVILISPVKISSGSVSLAVKAPSDIAICRAEVAEKYMGRKVELTL